MSDELLKAAIEHGAAFVIEKVVETSVEKLRELTNNGRVGREIEESNTAILVGLADRISALEIEAARQRRHFVPLFHRLHVEAVYAAGEERRAMLIDALAGIVKFDDAAELQSRVARAVMQLEPSDVARLHVLGRMRTSAVLPVADDHRPWGGAVQTIEIALEQAQCITREVDDRAAANARRTNLASGYVRGKVTVTDLGLEVLRYLGRMKPAEPKPPDAG